MDAAKRPAGRLRLSMPVEFGLSLIATRIEEFAGRYPDIAFDLDLSSRPAPFADQKADVSVRPAAITDPPLVVGRLGGTARVLCASPSCLAAACGPVARPA